MRGRDLIETRGGLLGGAERSGAARRGAQRREAERSGEEASGRTGRFACAGLGCMTQSTQSRSPLTCRVT